MWDDRGAGSCPALFILPYWPYWPYWPHRRPPLVEHIDNPVTARLVRLLEQAGVAFHLLRHAPVFTSEQAAAVRGTPLEEGAKALVCRADGQPALLVVPAHMRVGSRLFRRAFKVKDLRLVSGEEVQRLTGVPIGAVPPFGEILGLPTYLDERLLERERMAFNAGDHTISVTMATADYRRLVRATLGRFGEAPPA